MFITDYIKVYENAIPDDLCDVIVQRFDDSTNVTSLRDVPEGSEKVIRSCMELVTSKEENFKDIQVVMMKIAELAVGKYQSEIPVRTFPKEIGCELYRVQQFRAGEDPDHFDYHVDVNNYASARRFTSLVWFLNDVEKGGGYFFPHPNVRVKPVKGRLVLFPSTWMYPYSIERPVSNDSYIITTYLHYI
jgi:hypothetical protein